MEKSAGEREAQPENFVIIREIYEHNGAPEDFENELEKSLEACIQTIVIEPTRLGDETAKWITVGNCLHKTAVLCGLGTILGEFYPRKSFLTFPLGFTSVVCAGVYAVSWQFDPCCKYQVENDIKNLQRLPLHNLASSSPVVLIRRDDRRRKVLQNTVALISGAICSYKLYCWYCS